MTNFDLCAALRQYREENKLTMKQMGDKLNMSKSAYHRLEKGITKPTYDDVPKIVSILKLKEGQIVGVPPTPPKWYQSKKWRWVIPFIPYLFLTLIADTPGFREAYGAEQFDTNPPTAALIVLSVVLSAIYWYFWPPEWPLKKEYIQNKFRAGRAGASL